MENDTANTTGSIGQQPLSALQTIGAIIFTMSTLICISAYLLVLTTLVLYFKEFKSYFYLAVISLGIADLSFLVLVLIYCVPCTILQRQIWPSVPELAGTIEGISYFSQCNHLAYIAINHVVRSTTTSTNHPTVEKIFNRPFTVGLWIGLLWLLATPLMILWLVAGCAEFYDYERMAFVVRCQDEVSTHFTLIVTLANNVASGFLPSLIALLHVVSWTAIRLRGRRNTSNEMVQQQKRERRLLAQFTLASSALALSYVTFWAIPAGFGGQESPALVLITLASIFSAGVTPFIYLCFNRLMKTKAKRLLCNVMWKRSNAVGDSPGPQERGTAPPAKVK